MAASVTVHHKAFGDRRFAYLAELAGYADGADSALGKMTRLWSLCTERQTNTPDVREIRACLGPRGEEHLVEAGLAELLEDGHIRVKGCQGKIEWYGELPAQQSSAGKARASGAQRDARGRLLPRTTAGGAGHGKASALAGALAGAGSSGPAVDQRHPASEQDLRSLSPDLRLLPPELPDPPAIVGADRVPPPGIPKPGSREPRVKLNHDTWQYAALEHARLRGEGISADAIPWPVMPAGEPGNDLTKRTLEVCGQSDPPNYEAARATMKRRVDVAVAEARRDRDLRWFTPSRLWDAKSFWRALEYTPEQAAAPRAGPRGSPPTNTEPPRRIKTLS